jgi:galactokinase
MKPFRVRAPGRICLFGEHSDYLGLNVIPAAINLAVEFFVKPRDNQKVRVEYSDLGQTDSFELHKELQYKNTRDYLRSVFNVLSRRRIVPNKGADIFVKGEIPLAAGLSSSSAFTVAGVLAVAKLAETELPVDDVVQLAFDAEVREFGESGGMMDHFASVYGGIIHVDFGEQTSVTKLPDSLDGLVIGDSLEKQETVGDLRMIRTAVEEGYAYLRQKVSDFENRSTSVNEVAEYINELPMPSRLMTLTTLKNRDLTKQALEALQERTQKPKKIGALLDQHHSLLRDGLDRSTPKIEKLISKAKEAGALGCKVIGSGGGGTMLAYAPGIEDKVAETIRAAGGVPYKVNIAVGAAVQLLED